MKYKTDIVEQAMVLAHKWHKRQVRKGDDSPYIIHPIMVATLLAKNGCSDETIAAGFCHDLLEDTKCLESEISSNCGDKVLKIVKAVTNDKKLEGKINWWKKKELYIQTVDNGPIEAKAVCIADKIHNLKSLILAYDLYGTNIWSKFNASKEDKLLFEQKVFEMLSRNWTNTMLIEYAKLIEVFNKIVNNNSFSKATNNK